MGIFRRNNKNKRITLICRMQPCSENFSKLVDDIMKYPPLKPSSTNLVHGENLKQKKDNYGKPLPPSILDKLIVDAYSSSSSSDSECDDAETKKKARGKELLLLTSSSSSTKDNGKNSTFSSSSSSSINSGKYKFNSGKYFTKSKNTNMDKQDFDEEYNRRKALNNNLNHNSSNCSSSCSCSINVDDDLTNLLQNEKNIKNNKNNFTLPINHLQDTVNCGGSTITDESTPSTGDCKSGSRDIFVGKFAACSVTRGKAKTMIHLENNNIKTYSHISY